MRVRKPERTRAAGVRAVWMNLAVNTAVLDVPENLLLEKIVAILVELIGGGDQRRQPMRGALHPAALAALEGWGAVRRQRVLDAEPVEGAGQPLAPVDFIHADVGVEPLGDLGERGVTPLQ